MGKKRVGSRKIAKKIDYGWTEEDIKEALHELKSTPSVSVRSVAKKHGIHEATLRFRYKKSKDNEDLKKAGRPSVFDAATEKKLADCIGVVCNLGFIPTMMEIAVIMFFVL